MKINNNQISETSGDSEILHAINHIFKELHQDQNAFENKISSELNNTLIDKCSTAWEKYVSLHILNICVVLDPKSLKKGFESELKMTLISIALFEPSIKTLSEKANHFFKKEDQKYGLLFFELLLECIEFWHANDESNKCPVFKEMYCILLKNGVHFIEEPVHVLKFLGFIDELKHKYEQKIDLKVKKDDRLPSLAGSTVKSILFSNLTTEQTPKNEAQENEYHREFETFQKVLKMVLDYVITKDNADEMLGEFMGTLEECIQRLSKYKNQLQRNDLEKLKTGLFVLNSYFQSKSFSELKKMLVNLYAKSDNIQKKEPIMVDSITIQKPNEFIQTEQTSLVDSKASKFCAFQKTIKPKTQNITLNFKTPTEIQNVSKNEQQSSHKKSNSAQKKDSGKKMETTFKLESDKKVRSKNDEKSMESIKDTISFKSFELIKQESGKKTNKFAKNEKDGVENYFVHFVEVERHSLKVKIRKLKDQLVQQEEKYKKQIEELQSKCEDSTAKILNLENDNKRLNSKIVEIQGKKYQYSGDRSFRQSGLQNITDKNENYGSYAENNEKKAQNHKLNLGEKWNKSQENNILDKSSLFTTQFFECNPRENIKLNNRFPENKTSIICETPKANYRGDNYRVDSVSFDQLEKNLSKGYATEPPEKLNTQFNEIKKENTDFMQMFNNQIEKILNRNNRPNMQESYSNSRNTSNFYGIGQNRFESENQNTGNYNFDKNGRGFELKGGRGEVLDPVKRSFRSNSLSGMGNKPSFSNSQNEYGANRFNEQPLNLNTQPQKEGIFRFLRRDG